MIERSYTECQKVIDFTSTTLRDCIKKKQDQNRLTRTGFPALYVSDVKLLQALIGSLHCRCAL